jgi:hypothetical protein
MAGLDLFPERSKIENLSRHEQHPDEELTISLIDETPEIIIYQPIAIPRFSIFASVSNKWTVA